LLTRILAVELAEGIANVSRAGNLLIACALAASFAACFVDNPNAKPEPQPQSRADAASSVPVVAPVKFDGGPSVCERIGGFATAERVTAALAGELLADCRVNAYFNTLSQDRVIHLVDCLGKQIGTILECPGIRYDVDRLGVQCRGMRASHQGLAIRNGDLDALVEDLVRVLLREGFTQADIDLLAPGILSLRGDIVTNSAPGNNRTVCDTVDSGTKDAGPIDASTGG
jgi:hypothetical protein